MQNDQKPKEEKFIPSYDSTEAKEKFIPSYDSNKTKEKFIPSYDSIEEDKKFKPTYGRPRRSILNLILDYYKIILVFIVILIVAFLYTEYF